MTPSHMFMKPYQLLQPYGVSNSYGLFRQMTGVGDSSKFDQEVNWGWTELPPSIVERPEIILEGFFIKEEKWRELNFRWKPGDVMKRPKQVAPHQPRVRLQFIVIAIFYICLKLTAMLFFHIVIAGLANVVCCAAA